MSNHHTTSPSPVSARTTTSLEPGSRYRVDPTRSSLHFTTRHLFGVGRVAGTMTITSGEVDTAAETGAATVRATLAAVSFDTGNTRRDTDVRGPKFLDAEAHPTLNFEGGLGPDGRTVHGQLTVRGQTAPVELLLSDVVDSNGTLAVEASGRIDRYALGVMRARGMAARHLRITISVTLAQS